jgi:hypothetical protein
MHGYSMNINILFYVTLVMGNGFYERGKRKVEMFLDILSDFDIPWTTKVRTNSSIRETVHV